jgi:hypothetical protein
LKAIASRNTVRVTSQQTKKCKKRESEHGGDLLTMVVMMGSREVKEDVEAKERGMERGR